MKTYRFRAQRIEAITSCPQCNRPYAKVKTGEELKRSYDQWETTEDELVTETKSEMYNPNMFGPGKGGMEPTTTTSTTYLPRRVLAKYNVYLGSYKCKFCGHEWKVNDTRRAGTRSAEEVVFNSNKQVLEAISKGITLSVVYCRFCGTKNKPDQPKCTSCGATLA
jgi:transcription elongation factor Elf1